jgi:hypothetical protein
VAGMTFVPMRLIDHVETLRRECGGELFGNAIPDLHEI